MPALREIETNDVPAIALMHTKAFPNFFLTTLGLPFLETYYRSVIKHSTGIGICAIDGSNIIGFAVGTSNSKNFHKRILIINILPFLYHSFRILVINPNSIIRLFLNLEKKTKFIIPPFSTELLSIGVDSNYKGQGIGKLLLDEFESIAKHRNSSAIILTTDFFNNESTLKFYDKCGYLILCEFSTYPKRRMYKMIKHLKSGKKII